MPTCVYFPRPVAGAPPRNHGEDLMKPFIALAALALMSALSGCSGDSTTQSCSVDAECPLGTVCVGGTCQSVSCGSSGDCETNQICLSGTSVCAAAECGCADCPACADGFSCMDGTCVSNSCEGEGCPCTASSDCSADHLCKDGSCVACAPGECEEPSGCTVTGCAAGEMCDEATGECLSATAAGACQPCTNDSECGEGGWSCLPVGGSQVCLAPCGSSDDCATGWTCWGGACTPASFKCLGCAVNGCENGQVCDTSTGDCKAATPECNACEYDWECGATGACHSISPGVRVCVPRCSANTPCPGSSSCVDDPDSGYKVCKPQGASCCFDANPANCPDPGEQCTPACGGSTPHCKLGICVECLSDNDCAGQNETCDSNTWTCVGAGGCGGNTPYLNEQTGECVQCLSNDHCGGDTCNPQTNMCEGDLCATCAAPYPACTQVNGEYYCVQCTDDSYCGAGGTCNLETYSCEGGTVTPTDPCTSDADCDAGVSGFSLYCGDDGLCHDEEGGCDDITAYCLNGNECSDLLSLLGGGALPGGLPGGGGATLPGVCECTPDGSPVDGLPFPLPGISGSKDCPDGVVCGNLFDLLDGGGGGGTTNVCGGGLPF